MVRPAAEGRFAVVAGGRRLAQANALLADGVFDGEYPVPCRIQPDAEDAHELSLAENVTAARRDRPSGGAGGPGREGVPPAARPRLVRGAPFVPPPERRLSMSDIQTAAAPPAAPAGPAPHGPATRRGALARVRGVPLLAARPPAHACAAGHGIASGKRDRGADTNILFLTSMDFGLWSRLRNSG